MSRLDIDPLRCVFAVYVFCLASAARADPIMLVVERQGEKLVGWIVEVADTPDSRQRGLMWRETLPPRRGMLFDFEREQPIRMWMKNTPIALDMLFVDDSGVVIDIKRNARPRSLEVIAARLPARYTIEVNAGEVDEYGVRIGDRIERLDSSQKKR